MFVLDVEVESAIAFVRFEKRPHNEPLVRIHCELKKDNVNSRTVGKREKERDRDRTSSSVRVDYLRRRYAKRIKVITFTRGSKKKVGYSFYLNDVGVKIGTIII